ncbi:hypothetical protein ACHAPT_005279 [Fusarium lateritium]
MSRDNELEMSSFESLPLERERDPSSREMTQKQGSRPDFGLSKYSPLNHTADDSSSQGTSTTGESLQDPRARGSDNSSETLIQDSTSRGSPFKKLNDPEPPKKVCSNGVWSALGHLALFQLPAVVITLVILSLYIAQVRWGYLTGEQLSVLQFIAKGHEILILVSLADILTHRVCYGLLVDKTGVPLGFLSSPFQLGAPVLYLFSWELWAAILQPGAKRSLGRPRITGFIIIIAILLSLAAAPLSAIAIIPREGWQQVDPQPNAEEVITYLKTQLYKTELKSEYAKLLNEPRPKQEDLFKMLMPTIGDPPKKVELSTARQIANITYPKDKPITDKTSNRIISLTMDIPKLTSGHLAIATCPMTGVASEFVQFWREDKYEDLLTRSHRKSPDSAEIKRWKQPVVAVECSENKTTGPEASFTFYSNITDNNVVLSTNNTQGFKKLLEDARRKKSPKPGYELLNLEESPISAAMVFVTGTSNGSHIQGEEEGSVRLHLCRIYARWEEADVWVEQGKSTTVQSQLDLPLSDVYGHFRDSSKSDIIKMREEWLGGLGHRGMGSASSKKTGSIYQQIRDFCYSGNVDTTVHYCLHITLAAHMTDALTLTGRSYRYGEGKGAEPKHNDTLIHQTYYVGGYAYDISRSRTIPLAISVLLLHVAVALVHAVTVLSCRHPWHGSSWSSFGQILVLALRSKASDELGSVGGGVESSQTWNTSASVGVVGDERRLEMILRRRETSQELDDEGDDEGDTERGSSGVLRHRVQPDVKYH